MKFKSPQPHQILWHVKPSGTTYRSDVDRDLMGEIDERDRLALLELGCEEILAKRKPDSKSE